jgi:hypothetical protein
MCANRLISPVVAALLLAIVFTTLLRAADMDGVVMERGQVIMMKNGKPVAPIQGEMTMANGSKVLPDGTVKIKSGAEIHLKDGDMIMMDGHIMTGGKAKAMEK